MPRLADLRIRIGDFPPGPTDSVLDVPGVGLGHATVWRDEPDPPEGRGIARTGVTAIDPGGNLFRSPLPAGGAVLNGAGECTGFLSLSEWGRLETPIFLTSTMQVGRVYDAACELLIGEDAGIGDVDVVIPVVAECDDSFLSDPRRMQVTADDVANALAQARASRGGSQAPPEGAVGAGAGTSFMGYKGGIGTASRLLPDGSVLAAVALTNIDEPERLTIDGVPFRRFASAGAGSPRPPDGSCIVVLLTDGPLDASGCERLARRAGLGLARIGSTARNGSGEIFLAAATGLRADRGTATDRAPVTGPDLNPYFVAAVEATESAALNSLLQATTVTGYQGNSSPGIDPDEVVRVLKAHSRV